MATHFFTVYGEGNKRITIPVASEKDGQEQRMALVGKAGTYDDALHMTIVRVSESVPYLELSQNLRYTYSKGQMGAINPHFTWAHWGIKA